MTTEVRRVACAACGRLVAATRAGRPRRHKSTTRIGGGALGARERRLRARLADWCPGSGLRGDAP